MKMEEDRRVIVIGSGPTGAMAAYQLVQCGIPVTMLESGSTFQGGSLLRIMGRNLYRRVPPMEHGRYHISSGDPKTDWYYNFAPGGLSNQWTGAVPRFAPEDFTEGERVHVRYRWPITYEELVPYYTMVEQRMEITAGFRDVPNLPAGYAAYRLELPPDWQRIGRFAEARGQGLTILPLADGPPWLMVRRGTAFNSFTNIVRPLLRSPHFQLLTGVHALRLEWSGTKKRVEAVLYQRRSDGTQHRLMAEAVIVACGPLHSTKLLFDSACSDFPQGLGNTEGLLGCYLHDHPREWWVFDIDKPLTLLSPSAYLTRKPYDASPPLLAPSWTLGVVSTVDKILSRFSWKGRSIGVQVFGTMVPSEKHYVKPAEAQKDEFGLPLLEIHICYDENVIQNVIQARHHLLSLMEEAGYRTRLRNVLPQLFPGSSVHYGGTIRMHHSRKYGMVDAWNRLYDVPNVVVCDASCFTTGPEKNPTLTAMAIAARAADRLANDLKTR
jgi:choline dehydrogenase-like flavoprotein